MIPNSTINLYVPENPQNPLFSNKYNLSLDIGTLYPKLSILRL
jgi:hypothetical protein